MIQHPGIMSLLIGSLLTSLLLLHASRLGVQILHSWDLQSGSELQLQLERRTYLISTILGSTLVFQIASLFLYVFTADRIHSQFVGAMCAAGSLNVNGYGYAALLAKIVSFFSAALLLLINHTDTKGYDYPLIRVKYALLLAFVPLVLLEGYLQYNYFSGLKADVITSCCGSLFSSDKRNITGDLAGLPAGPMEIAFFGSMTVTVAAGIVFLKQDRGGYLFATLSTLTLVIALAAMISFISLYFYEMPTHHCPFCLLQKEYGFVGYPLYGALLGGGVAGLGVGILMPFRARVSLSRTVPLLQQRLAVLTICLYSIFTLIVACRMLTTPFKL